MVPFACIHCRTKRIKTNSTKKKNENRREKEILLETLRVPRSGDLTGPPTGNAKETILFHEKINIIRNLSTKQTYTI
jgi:hypothetical protein